ncbi:MAG: pitrilysin family protein [Deinococcus sp.]|nr:pitrilysin family protein [Deinococcus sp.]
MKHSSRFILWTLGLSLGSGALAAVTGGGQPQTAPVSLPATSAVTAPAGTGVIPALPPRTAAPVRPSAAAAPTAAPTPTAAQGQGAQVTQPAQNRPAPATATQAAQPPGLPAGVTFVTQAEGIKEYRLSNGLRVLLFPDPSAGKFTLNVTYLVGSVHENYGETGMAHLLEHLVFKGTPTSGNIMEALGQRGANFNGTTSLDRTNYFETMSNSGDNLKWAIGMEADRMVNSRISGDDLKTEMTVVRNELESGENNPIGLTLKELQSVAYDWHNYGNSTIGNRSDVENVPVDRLQAFYRTHYQPDNAVVTLAGDFDEAQALGLIAQEFGKIPAPTRTLPPQYTREPAQNGERSLTVRRVGDVQALMAAYHIPSVRHADTPALLVLNELLGDEPSGRLYAALVQSGQASSAGTFPLTGSEPGLMIGLALLDKDDDLDAAQATLLATLEQAGEQAFGEEEVARAKQRLATQHQQLMTQPAQVGVALSEAIAAGDWRLLLERRDAVERVTAADVQRVARTYFKPSNRTLARFIPAAQPDRVDIAQAPSAEDVLRGFVGGEALGAGEVLDVTPAALEQRVVREEIGGAAVAMLPKDTRGDRVQLQLALDYGTPETVRQAGAAPDFLGELLTRGSTGLTRQQLRDRLEAINTNLSVSGGAEGLVVRLDTERQHLPAALELLRSVLREPTFPENELAELKTLTLTGLEAGRSEPQSVAGRELGRIFMPEDAKRGDLFYVPTLDEDLEDVRAVTVQDVRDYYKSVVGAGRAQLSVVGDFDPQTIRAAVPQLLGGWTSPVAYERVVRPLTRPAGVQRSINVPDKANAVYIAAQNFALRDDHPDAAALEVAMRVFGAGTDSRLWNRVRQQDGLSYGVGAQTSLSSRDEQGVLSAFAIYNPGVREKLSAAMQEEFRRVAQGGFTEAEINNAKSGLLEEARLSRTQDSALAGALLLQADLGRTFAFDQQWEERVAAVTPEQARAAFVKYINPDDLVEIQAGSFE